jgi:ribose transport system ATP-binding protein
VESGAARTRTASPALELHHLSKTFAGRTVLRDAELVLARGEIHALLGQNGSGKSTLIKCLAGYHLPDEGSHIVVGGEDLEPGSPTASYQAGCRFVHQDLALIDSLSIADNLFLSSHFPTRIGMVDRRRCRRLTARALSAIDLELDPNRLVGTLRPSERTGVAVARALLSDGDALPSVVVLDEPTATLPSHEVEALLTTLRATAAAGVAILYVTHHIDEVRSFAQRVSILRNGALVGTWNVADVRTPELVRELVGEALAEQLSQAQDTTEVVPAGEPVLSVRSLAARRLRELTLDVRPGEVVGLYGLTGSGREDALTAIFGAIQPDGGSVSVAGVELRAGRPTDAIDAGIGYLPPDRKTLGAAMELSARHNMTLLDIGPFFRRGLLRRRPESSEASYWFERLGVEPRNGEGAPLRTFSGGNQQKVLLAKWLRIHPKVLLLEEPSQGVDVGAKLEVHRQIQEAAGNGAAVVISSSEVEELVALCHRVLVIRAGRVGDELTGDRVTMTEINLTLHRGENVQQAERVN